MAQKVHPVRLAGGLDFVTPHTAKRDGVLLGCSNYEPDVAGYRRFPGYERFDGRPRPSDASYWVLEFDAATDFPSAGDTVTGGASGATGVCLVDAVQSTATTGYAVLRDVSGTFVDDEDLEVSAVKFAEADGTAEMNGGLAPADDQYWKSLAAAARRSSITAVTGSGAVRGVVRFGGNVYAIRDNAGATAAVLFKATSSGWTSVDLGSRVAFTAGTAAFVVGEVLTGGTSSATGTIARVAVTSGSFAGSDAAGYIYLRSLSGTFQAAETITGATAGSATCSGAQTANTLPAGGKYEFVVNNFYGAASDVRLYGANGVGPAFEFDGTNFAFIFTGLDTADEKPAFIAEFRGHLFLGYARGSWQYSAIGDPMNWEATNNAGEIAVGSAVTGGVRAASVLVLMAENRVDYVQGQPGTDAFERLPVSQDSGGIAYTLQMVDAPVYMDAGAIRGLQQTQALGGWRMGAMSRMIEPLFDDLQKAGTVPVCSMRVRAKDLYRVFMSDKTVISVHLGRDAPEFGRLDLDDQANCAWSSEESGVERSFIGADDGFVYETDVGTDFDGAAIVAWGRTNYIHAGAPQQKKRFVSVLIEADTPAYSTIKLACETDFGDPDRSPTLEAKAVTSGGGFWDVSRWDEFVWDAKVTGETRARINAIGRQASVVWWHEGDRGQPSHTLQMITLYMTPRGLSR